MTRIVAAALAAIAISTFSSVAMAHHSDRSGDRSTGETASGAGGANSDHTTDGRATDKSGGNNQNGGRD